MSVFPFKTIEKTRLLINYSKASMARTLMVHSPGLARTIFMVPTASFMHNPPWMPGTTIG